ncbi:hypothetical protein QYE76_026269 [Lolium multiflorum]|uniref:Uncharacterized protein n=1 Tax=Lolium multiflorum TaxID=4521 RepID=A0AAD8RGY7_LOLMU|nr:hypothetical protein QYE76_026269 [Lolium multiflorum]
MVSRLPSPRMLWWRIELQLRLHCPDGCASASVREAATGQILSFWHLTPPPMCGRFPLSNGCRAYMET